MTILCENGQQKKVMILIENNIDQCVNQCLVIATKYNMMSVMAKLNYKQDNFSKAVELRLNVIIN